MVYGAQLVQRCSMIVNHIPACQASDPRKLLIKGGTVVNADRKFPADVYCEEGIIRWGVIRDRANYNNIILSPLWIMCQSNYVSLSKVATKSNHLQKVESH